jgi:hypothetical protein
MQAEAMAVLGLWRSDLAVNLNGRSEGSEQKKDLNRRR